MAGMDRAKLRGSARLGGALALLLVAVACGGRGFADVCEPTVTVEELEARVSPYTSHSFEIGGQEVTVCYSRPSARGRAVFGGLVPYDTLWRTGANEPTIVHTPLPLDIAGLLVEPGAYSLYTVPSEEQWRVVVNASTSQWGLTRDEYGIRGNLQPNAYTEEVRAQEVGRAPIRTESIPFVEQLLIRTEALGPDRVELVVEWETTRVVIPVRTPPASR